MVAIRAHCRSHLKRKTGCKHENIGRGVVAPEAPREAGDRGMCLCLTPGNNMGYCALSPVLPLVFHKIT